MPIQNVNIIDTLVDLKTAFDLIIKDEVEIGIHSKSIEFHGIALSTFQKNGFPTNEDVNFKSINADNAVDFMNKYLLIEGSLRLAASQDIMTLDEYEEYSDSYMIAICDPDNRPLSDDDAINIIFDFVE